MFLSNLSKWQLNHCPLNSVFWRPAVWQKTEICLHDLMSSFKEKNNNLIFDKMVFFTFLLEMCTFFRVLYQHHLWSEANAVIRLRVVTWGGPVTLPASIICRKLQVTDNTHNIRAKPPEQSGSYLHFLRCAFLPVITCSSFPTFGVLYLYVRSGSIIFHVSCPKSVW